MPSKPESINLVSWLLCPITALFARSASSLTAQSTPVPRSQMPCTWANRSAHFLAARVKCLLWRPQVILHCIIITILIIPTVALAKKSPELKAKIEYNLKLEDQLKIRVTKIPTEFGMLGYDDNGDLLTPKIGSVINAETTEDLNITDTNGQVRVMPAGTKFYARVTATSEAKSYQKDGSVELEFFKFELPTDIARKVVYLRANSLAASTKSKPKSKLSKALSVGAYSLAGLIAAPLSTAAGLGLSGNIVGLSSGIAPYVYGGSALLGGGLGLAYGLSRKGTMYHLEPGADLIVRPSVKWQLTMSESLPTLEEVEQAYKRDSDRKNTLANECAPGANCPQDPNLMPVVLTVSKVKKAYDIYGSPCLKISFNYKNNTRLKLRYSSFVLVDSMGKEYELSPGSLAEDFIGELPSQAMLTLNFAVDFPKTVHYLQALDPSNHKVLARAKVLL